MAGKTCFVAMPIGDQHSGDKVVSAAELRQRYTDLIKEALSKADPNLEITRADDVAAPGTITSDILTRLMHSDLVVCDVSFPNPNVFYELGIRHACRTGTLIIRDRTSAKVPFDISGLRYIEYESTPSGLKQLADDFKASLDFFNKNPGRPDNHVQELAQLTGYEFPNYAKETEDPETEAFIAVMQSPAVLDILVRQASGEEVSQADLLGAVVKDPQLTSVVAKALMKTGQLSLSGNTQQQRRPQQQRRGKGKGGERRR